MKPVTAGIFHRVLKEKMGLTSDAAAKAVFHAVAAVIASYLKSGEAVFIPGIGRLEPVTLPPGEYGMGKVKVAVGERESVKFVVAKKMKRALNK